VTEVMTYDRMMLGRRFTPVEFRVGADTLAAYRGIVGRQASSTPVGLLAIYARRAYLTEGTMPSGGVMAGLEIVNAGVLPLETRLTATAVVSRREIRKGRGWVTIDITFSADTDTDTDADEFARVRVVGVWPL
jgi:hypothetical protein